MHPITLNAYQDCLAAGQTRENPWMRWLAGPHHFHLTAGVRTVAMETAQNLLNTTTIEDPAIMPETARLPADRMVLTRSGDDIPIMLARVKGGRPHEVEVTICAKGRFHHIARFAPGDFRFYVLKESQGFEFHHEHRTSFCTVVAMALSLINTPRIAECSRATGDEWSRQHKKAIHRLTKSEPLAFTRVSWTIGKPTTAKSSRTLDEDDRRPLHWCRGHFRRASKGEPLAEWLDIPWKGGWGFYSWITDCWKGHPDYGTKFQDHVPLMPGEKGRKGADRPSKVPDAVRWAAMTDVQRNTLASAGYLPTAVLQ